MKNRQVPFSHDDGGYGTLVQRLNSGAVMVGKALLVGLKAFGLV